MSACGNPAVEQEALMPKRTKFDKSKDCVKCKLETGNIVIRHAVYCKTCFFSLVTTKFRRSLDPHVNAASDGPRRTMLKASGNLLVGVSGGPGSAVLLDILDRSYFHGRADSAESNGGKRHPKKDLIWKKAAICYVEICDAFPEGTVKDRTEQIRVAAARYGGFDFIPVRLQDAFDKSWWERVRGTKSSNYIRINLANEGLDVSTSLAMSPSDSVTSLRTFLSSLPTQTAVLAAIRTLTRLLLLHTAWSTRSSHLALGTSLTSLSISLISSIAQGGGFNVQEESFEEWTYDRSEEESIRANDTTDVIVDSVRIVRPLREIGMKECAAWIWWSHLDIIGREKIPGTSAKQTIGGLTKDFIVGLERDYPSTVSTIARTCAKLAPKRESDGKCALCGRPSQRGAQEWKSNISIRSLTPSTSPVTESTTATSSSALSECTSFASRLCYACYGTFTSRSPRSAQQPGGPDGLLVPLPVWIRPDPRSENHYAHEMLQTRGMGRDDMKRAIGEFLIDD